MVATAEKVGYDDEQEVDEQQSLLERVKSDPELIELIKSKTDELIQLKKDRQAINEKMKAIREDLVAAGINRHAHAAAMARYELEETDREAREISYHACCTALGVEHQLELFKDVVTNAPRGQTEDAFQGTKQKPVSVEDMHLHEGAESLQ